MVCPGFSETDVNSLILCRILEIALKPNILSSEGCEDNLYCEIANAKRPSLMQNETILGPGSANQT